MLELLSDVRSLVYGLVDTPLPDPPAGMLAHVPTYLYLPTSADQLPCYVVQPATLDEGSQAAIAHVVVEVYALGRTIRDDDAQHELDYLADGLVVRLWNVDTSPMSCKLTAIRNDVVSVSNVDIPARIGTVEVSSYLCP